jgi:hypothetical protein
MEVVRASVRSGSWTPAVVCGTAAAAVFGAGAAGGVHGRAVLAPAIAIALVGLVLAARSRLELYRARSAADVWIARGYDSPRSRYGWRVAELTSGRERAALASAMHGIVAELEHDVDTGIVPLERAAVLPCRDVLGAIASRLGDLDRPVAACGVLGVRRLLTDGATSPLYCPTADPVHEFADVLGRLEVRR